MITYGLVDQELRIEHATELLEDAIARPVCDPPLLLAALELPAKFMGASGERALPKVPETLFSQPNYRFPSQSNAGSMHR